MRIDDRGPNGIQPIERSDLIAWAAASERVHVVGMAERVDVYRVMTDYLNRHNDETVVQGLQWHDLPWMFLSIPPGQLADLARSAAASGLTPRRAVPICWTEDGKVGVASLPLSNPTAPDVPTSNWFPVKLPSVWVLEATPDPADLAAAEQRTGAWG